MADEPAGNGGEGGGPNHLTRSEMATLARAVRKGQVFNLTDKGLVQAPADMEEMATDKEQCPRNRIAATKVLVAMAGHNLKSTEADKGQPGTGENPLVVKVLKGVSMDDLS